MALRTLLLPPQLGQQHRSAPRSDSHTVQHKFEVIVLSNSVPRVALWIPFPFPAPLSCCLVPSLSCVCLLRLDSRQLLCECVLLEAAPRRHTIVTTTAMADPTDVTQMADWFYEGAAVAIVGDALNSFASLNFDLDMSVAAHAGMSAAHSDMSAATQLAHPSLAYTTLIRDTDIQDTGFYGFLGMSSNEFGF